jgi:hypothetical protein
MPDEAPADRHVHPWRADGAACRLALSVVLDDAGKAARDSAGWESCLDMLAVAAAGQVPGRPAGTGPWEEYYEHYKAAGFPATAQIPT